VDDHKKIKVQWVTPEGSGVANALGYQSFNSAMKKHCAEYFEYADDAEIALQLVPADFFHPIPGKFNILFTMWECIDVPTVYIKAFNQADLIIVPSTWNQSIFKPLTKTPIKTCFLGVDTDVFSFVERKLPIVRAGEHFRLLWLGAPNPRKGYFSVLELVKIIEKIPEVELYMKTTSPKKLTLRGLMLSITRRLGRIIHGQKPRTELLNIFQSIKRFVMPEVADLLSYNGALKNIILDTRKLTREEIVALYHSAHCFVAPHMGEGWGLTLAEAMATGCPCVASDSTAVKDYFDAEGGYPIAVDVKMTDLQNYDLKQARVFIPDTVDMINQVFTVIRNYKDALKRGRRASYRIKTDFTWKKASKRLAAIIEEVAEKQNVAQQANELLITRT
jgi:glycosyltransferase involved in cell wall biosynthesis